MPEGIEAPAGTMAEGPTSHTLFQAVRPANTFGYSREEQIEALRKLREPFPQTEIRHLPRVWCGACKNSRGQGCNQHQMAKCPKCKQKMPSGGHIDLPYVGHAEATNRLLNVDPFWDWEPLTVDERGLPQADGYKGLWIRLTVCGMTRLGYGHAGDKTGGDAIKEVIGDAIRNAGMRFGMALDLWTTSDLEIVESGEQPPEQNTGGKPEAVRPASSERESKESQEQALARLTEQYRNCWANPLALVQIRIEGKQLGLSDERRQGPPPESEWTTFDALLETRINELNAERSAA
ncbi:hypothetical protein ACGFZS_47220 [Streptomyces sp. NPDC048288]|uniref:hypothetical protein n=1 Tax=Streptomyces sp. NPDC048288 TaxID=3365529 RepID=UPI0037172DD6